MLENLVELLSMDNPLLCQLPISLSSLKKLRVLDVRNTALAEIPREYAELQGCLRGTTSTMTIFAIIKLNLLGGGCSCVEDEDGIIESSSEVGCRGDF